MLSTTKNFQANIPLLEKIPILIVSPYADDYSSIRQILRNDCWQIEHARNLEEAATHLGQSAASVIICERDLPDGTWKDLLKRTQEFQPAPSILVVSRQADERLWSDVLNLGGYDVMPKPFERRDAVRIISMAWRTCRAKIAKKPVASDRTVSPHFAHAAMS
jgi:DNA-binding NtrC family response regulator